MAVSYISISMIPFWNQPDESATVVVIWAGEPPTTDVTWSNTIPEEDTGVLMAVAGVLVGGRTIVDTTTGVGVSQWWFSPPPCAGAATTDAACRHTNVLTISTPIISRRARKAECRRLKSAFRRGGRTFGVPSVGVVRSMGNVSRCVRRLGTGATGSVKYLNGVFSLPDQVPFARVRHTGT